MLPVITFEIAVVEPLAVPKTLNPLAPLELAVFPVTVLLELNNTRNPLSPAFVAVFPVTVLPSEKRTTIAEPKNVLETVFPVTVAPFEPSSRTIALLLMFENAFPLSVLPGEAVRKIPKSKLLM